MIATDKLSWMRQQHYQMAEPCPEWWSFIHQNMINPAALEPHCGTIGVALCKSLDASNGDRLFEFSSKGIACVVIEALCFQREGGNKNPYVADLVAWSLQAPNSFATALGTGEGCELLGAWSACRTDRSPLTVHRTPLAWLKAGCEGCVVLKQEGGGFWLNKAGAPFVCEDAEHAKAVRDLLGPSGHHHKILIPNSERKAA